MTQYRELDPREICATAEALVKRIGTQFPGSGLLRVARELAQLASQTEARIEHLRRPRWGLRLVTWGTAALLSLVALAAPVFISVRVETPGITDLMQGIDSAVNNVVFIALAIWFLITVEQRPRRSAALAALHELRSLAHIIDLHQLKKDPETVLSPGVADEESLSPLSRLQLSRYLDYCSELLSIVSKLAALYAQYFVDERVLNAVNDVETLTGAMSSKIWQKIDILDTIATREA